jgi:hypothetical protein
MLQNPRNHLNQVEGAGWAVRGRCVTLATAGKQPEIRIVQKSLFCWLATPPTTQ